MLRNLYLVAVVTEKTIINYPNLLTTFLSGVLINLTINMFLLYISSNNLAKKDV